MKKIKEQKTEFPKFLISFLFYFNVCIFSSFAQNTIRGTVNDDKGEALPGVTIKCKSSNLGTITDFNGKYSIEAQNNDVLIFSSIGMKTYETKVGNRHSINVIMQNDITAVDEIIVVGYGTQKKSSLTGSVAQIDNKQIMEAPVGNISNMLGGRLPGLISVQSSGQPGADNSSLLVRGISTYGNASPMVIVDGIPRSFNDLDPSEIQNISILKDASAAAVYGMQGSNGVILVTTKKGSEQKATITYSGSYGIDENTRFPKFMDGIQFATYWNKAMEMDGKTPTFTENMLKSIKNCTNGFGNTDWLSKIFRTGNTQHHNISVEGGTERTKYFILVGYYDQKGNLKQFNFNRFNFRSNIDAKITNDLSINLNLSGRHEVRENPNTDASTVVSDATRMLPYLPMKYQGMDVGAVPQYSIINPVASLNNSGFSNSKMNVFQSNLSLRWNIPFITGLNANALFSYDHDYTISKVFSTPYQVMRATLGYDNITYSVQNAPAGFLDPSTQQYESTLYEGFANAERFTGQVSLNYARRFGLHDLTALFLYEYSRYRTNDFDVNGEGFEFNDIQELNLSNKIINSGKGYGGGSSVSPRAGYVGRITYAYNNKYLLELSGRYDGSYKFRPEHRWAFFPAISFGWRISEENFFKETFPFVDNLKIRASYGKLGNDANVGAFQFYNYIRPISANPIVIIGGQQQKGYMTDVVPNPNLTWEVSTNYNIGLDATLWHGLLGIEFDTFYKITKHILSAQTGNFPSSVGNYFPSIINYGIVDNKGFELALTNNSKFGNVNFSARANINWARNKIIRIDDEANIPAYQLSVGREIGEKEGFVALGLFQSQDEINNSALVGSNTLPGDIKYKDLNGDGKIDYDHDRKWIGRSDIPEMMFGLNLSATWKNLDFSTLLQGATLCDDALMGNYPGIGWDDTQFTRTFYNGGNSPIYLIKNSWRPDNTKGKYPRLSTLYRYNGNASTLWLVNGAYLRLKDIQLGYSLPKSLCNMIHSQKIRIYFAGSNLLTLSHNHFLDPEAPDVTNGYYPQQRNYTFGLNVTF